MLALTLLVGGAAACGDDDDGGDDAATEEGGDTTAPEGESGDPGEGGDTDSAIDAFCAEVQELVDKTAELQDDPTNADLTAEVTELTTSVTAEAGNIAGGVASYTPEQVEKFEGCQTDLTEIGTGG